MISLLKIHRMGQLIEPWKLSMLYCSYTIFYYILPWELKNVLSHIALKTQKLKHVDAFNTK